MAGRAGTSTLSAVASVAAAALGLCAVAIFNGFPLVWYDTSSHLANALRGEQIWARTASYSLFLAALHWRLCLWTPVAVQSAITAYVLWLVMRIAIGAARPGLFVPAVLILAAGSSLPWFAGQLMPDVFTGLVVLGLFALVLGADRLSRGEYAVLLAITTLSVAMHLSHLPIALVLLAATSPAAWLAGQTSALRWRPLAAAVGALLAAAAVVLALNVTYTGLASLTPYGPVFLLARLVEDEPAVFYLRGHCADGRFRLCEYLPELPMDVTTFLWAPRSPLRRAGGIETFRDEAAAIVAGTLRAYPRFCLRVLVFDTLYQLGRFETGWEFGPYGEGPDSPGASVPREIRTFFPGSFRAYSEARQQQGTLPIEAVRRVHRGVFLAGLAVNALFLAWTWLRRWARPPGLDPPPWCALPALILLIGVGVVANALVAGGLAQVADRYGSRVAWLVVWSALLCLAAPLAARRGGPALSV